MFQYKHQKEKDDSMKKAILRGTWFTVGAVSFLACIGMFALAVTGGF